MARERKRHVNGNEVAAEAAVADPAISLDRDANPPHPCLVELVRLLARQAAAEDISRQRRVKGP